jgi:2,3-bisphosphoglycerate-dependent phosphoglycerate mutase
MSTLILVRHGQSVWNAENRFTGWVDSPLSELGRKEAESAGLRLAAEGIRVGKAFTSTLTRAQDTGRLILAALGQEDLGQEAAWQLNERFYGALTGRNKAQTSEELGAAQVLRWRRSYDVAPPGGESLAHTAQRVLPFFCDRVLAAAREHAAVLVCAHGNSLRAVVKELDGIADEEFPALEIPTGVPMLYDLHDGVASGKRILD